MLPVLLDLKFIKIYTFGVFLVLSFFWGSFLLWRNIRLTQYKEEEIFDGLFISLGGALLLSRVVYVALHFDKFGFDFLKFILINGFPGLSLYGGLAGGLTVLYLFCLSRKIKFLEVTDYFISPLFLALAFGKLGSFFSGAEVGTKTGFPLSIRYAGYDELRHLTPFYEALFFFAGSYIAYRLLFEIRKERLTTGFLIIFFLWYYSLVYFVFDRMKEQRVYLMGQSLNGMLSLIILLTSSFFFLYYFRNLVPIKSYVAKTYSKIAKEVRKRVAFGGSQVRKTDRRAKKE